LYSKVQATRINLTGLGCGKRVEEEFNFELSTFLHFVNFAHVCTHHTSSPQIAYEVFHLFLSSAEAGVNT
jgi:hypothetical protein